MTHFLCGIVFEYISAGEEGGQFFLPGLDALPLVLLFGLGALWGVFEDKDAVAALQSVSLNVPLAAVRIFQHEVL